MTPAEILARAADVIETRGWNQGWYIPRGADPATAPVCARGAINVAVGLPPDVRCAVHGHRLAIKQAYEADEALRRHLDVITISNWNDAADQTAEQVTAGMRACAAELAGGAA